MKKYVLMAGLFLFGALLAACGAKEEMPIESTEESAGESVWQGMAPGDDLTALAERTEYYDFKVETEELFDLGLWEKSPQEQKWHAREIIRNGGTAYILLGTQFWKGEPVQLWMEASLEEAKVWLYKKDGSSELLLQNVPEPYHTNAGDYGCYMDAEGTLYCYPTTFTVTGDDDKFQSFIAKIPSSGEIQYESMLEPGLIIDDICQTKDGRIYLQLLEGEKDMLQLAELDPGIGALIPGSRLELPFERAREVLLGTMGAFPAVLGYSDEDRNLRIVKVDVSDGSIVPILYFAGTSYGYHSNLNQQDFQISEDGSVDILQIDVNGTCCLLERLWIQKVDKIPIVVRGGYWVDHTFREQVAQFNMGNDTYQVIVEDCVNLDEREDFARLTSVQIGAGGGPDILYGVDLMEDYIVGMLEKGALEDLSPYMEASGIREEDYFPMAFSTWRQGERIYGANYRGMLWWQRTINEEALGSREVPDIETFLNALLSREGTVLYASGMSSKGVLREWLEGTDSLWGMVDWEAGSCDFNTPLFQKLLEAAERYGDDGRKNPEFEIADYNNLRNVLYFSDSAELEAAGKVSIGTLFDDGSYVDFDPMCILAINANSSHKEGAWEFIRFMLSEEIQGTNFDTEHKPMNRKAFDEWMLWTIARLTDPNTFMGSSFAGEEVSEKRQAEYKKVIEEARPLPRRTAFLLDIILDEAQDYFNGYKSPEQVGTVINNRVQLYLDENH